MSHFSKINAEISDEEALKSATDKMGFSLVPGGKCRYYYGARTADMVIKLPGKYDVALTRKDGVFSVSADLYGNEVQRYIGEGANLLMQQYAAEKVRIEAFKRSLAVTESTDDNNIILTLTDIETGGQINITCHLGGKIDLKTSGFPGDTCMNFQNFEASLGCRIEFSPTMEMYQEKPVVETEVIYTSEQ